MDNVNKTKIVRRKKEGTREDTTPNIFSLYGRLLYIELEKRRELREFTVSLEELKNILRAPELSNTYSHLRLRVLDSIKKELELGNTPLKFEYNIVKEEHILKVKFTIINEQSSPF